MNTQRNLHRLVRVALMVGTVSLLPSLQAKSVSVLDAITPMTAPPQNLTREVRQPPAPDARPQLVAPGCINGCPPIRNIGQAKPSTQRDESFDTTRLWKRRIAAATTAIDVVTSNKPARPYPQLSIQAPVIGGCRRLPERGHLLAP